MGMRYWVSVRALSESRIIADDTDFADFESLLSHGQTTEGRFNSVQTGNVAKANMDLVPNTRLYPFASV